MGSGNEALPDDSVSKALSPVTLKTGYGAAGYEQPGGSVCICGG